MGHIHLPLRLLLRRDLPCQLFASSQGEVLLGK
jgi:hypothetical protein